MFLLIRALLAIRPMRAMRVAVLALPLLATAVAAEKAPLTHVAWPIPTAAWRVPIGGCERGIPIGGIGAGSLMVNAAGAFGPWHFLPGRPEPRRRLAAAAFHFFEKPVGGKAKVTTLSSARLMPAWAPLPPASGSYHALFPKGWFTYRGFAADLSMKFFSPILRGAAPQTSFPVALFEFEVANPTDRPLDVAILFTFPNTPAHTAQLRTGFLNFPETDTAASIAGVVLDARSPLNPKDADDTEWCIAARAEHGGAVSYATSWNAMASGGDILATFASAGRLPNDRLDETDSAAAVAYTQRLRPRESATVPFALAWDFPRVALGPALWWRRYTEHAGQGANNAFRIARDALLHHAEWEADIDAWTTPIIDEPAYPTWLKQAALNELYYETFGGAFWEAGCITQPEEFKNLHPEDHKHFTLECPTEPYCEPLALRFAPQPARLLLWPQIERDTLIAYADLIDARGPFVHDLGTPSGNPFFEPNASPKANPKAKDLPALFVLQAYAYFHATDDRPFLDYVWSACKKCYAALRAADTRGYALPSHDGDDTVTSPCALHGTSLLGGTLALAALEALEHLAALRNDADAAAISRLIPLARANLDRQLWRPELRYYAIDTHSRHPDAIAAGALAGLRFAQANALPPILPAPRVRLHLQQAFRRCVQPLHDHDGDGMADTGAVNVMGSDRCPPNVGRCHEVSVADTYRLAATIHHVGQAFDDKALIANALSTAYGAYYQTWVVAPNKPFWAFDTPQAWRADNPARARATQHIQPRAIWHLLLDIKNPYAKAPAKD